jgi:Tfp pilus assembly protein FimT
VIVGILSAFAIPKFSSRSSYEKNFLFYEVLNSLRYARKLAVVTQCHVQVQLSASQLVLTRRTGTICTNTAAAFSVSVLDPVSGVNNYTRTNPGSGGVISSTLANFYFNGLGQVRDSSTNAVTSVQVTVGSRNIQIVGETGLSYEF